MTEIKIVCPQCKEIVIVPYRTVNYGHAAIDEALAIDSAIKDHKCK